MRIVGTNLWHPSQVSISVIFGEAPQLLLEFWSYLLPLRISLGLLSSLTVENRWFSVNLLETWSAFLLVALAASRLCNNALLLVY